MRDATQTPTPTMTTAPDPHDQPDDEISLLDLLQVIVDNLRLLVLGLLTVGILALGLSLLVKPTFTAETSFLPPQQQQGMAASMLASLGALGGLAGAATGLKNPANQYVAFLKSNSIEDALIERCMQAMAMDMPKAVLWQKIRSLRKVLPA